jgi:hypothetical protein
MPPGTQRSLPSQSVSIKDDQGNVINPPTAETVENLPFTLDNNFLWQIRRIVSLLQSNGIVDIAGKQRVVVDNQISVLPSAYYAAANQWHIPNSTPGPLLNASATYVQPVQTGPYDPRFESQKTSTMAYNLAIRNKLAFS